MLEYLPGATWVHRLDVRAKIFAFLALMIVSFLYQDPLFQLGMAGLTGGLAVRIKIPLSKVRAMLLPLIPIMISIILITGFTLAPERFARASSQTVLFYALPGHHLGATLGGFLLGITFILRLINIMMASAVLTLTTSIEEFTQFFQKMKLPPEVAMMLTMAIRFVPTLDKKRRQIIEAQKARGTQFNEKGIIGAIRSYLPIMIPLFINSIMMANSLSMAMLNRGYGLSRTRTAVGELTFASRDYGAMALIVLLLAAAFFLRFGLKLGVL